MTRINLVDPSELSDQHLLAEYRELPRVRHAYPRKKNPVIPTRYVLGKGHVTFFYNKGTWLEYRHQSLILEMHFRGFTVNLPALKLSHWPKEAMQWWEASPKEIEINRRRIQDRVANSKRPHTWTRRKSPLR